MHSISDVGKEVFALLHKPIISLIRPTQKHWKNIEKESWSKKKKKLCNGEVGISHILKNIFILF